MKIAFLIVGPAAFFAGATAFAALVFIDVTSEAFTLETAFSSVVAESLGFLGALSFEVCASTSSRTATSGEAERLRGAVDAGRAGCKGPVILER